MATLFDHAELLLPDNFTPRVKTPWAGKRIGHMFKRELCPESIGAHIGESWEFSCDLSMPSHLLSNPKLNLREVAAEYPHLFFPENGPGSRHHYFDILVKIIDAGDHLSFQVHPSDDDKDLAEDECGKPESWLILAAEDGAGIYLGFREGVSKKIYRSVSKHKQIWPH